MEKKSVFKNYFILGFMMVLTIVVSFYVLNWYKQYEDTKVSEPIITSVLREVKYDNLDSILQERDFLIVYMCTSEDSVCRNFEKKFKNYIKDENLEDDIVYYNLNSNGTNRSIKEVYNKYKNDDLIKKVYDYPTLLIFNEGEIIDVLSSSKNKKINVSSVKEFLGDYEI